MSRIVFFSIPAYGHTNPTLQVVRELTRDSGTARPNQVRYYSFSQFREPIEAAGAEFIDCDGYLPPLKAGDEKKIGKDFSAMIAMVADTTLAMGDRVCKELKEYRPDCIVADSMCTWGKLFARRLGIPLICSTTTFAFNQYSARNIRRGIGEMLYMLAGLPKIGRKLGQLRDAGYDVPNLITLIENDNDTDTIVFTSREFQPDADTFSRRVTFVGPSLRGDRWDARGMTEDREGGHEKKRPVLYISMGTINNKNQHFYENCFEAFGDQDMDVILSLGTGTDPGKFARVPGNFSLQAYVDQLEVLSRADAFVTHCGMNSVNESLFFGVPMVLYPQQSEQRAVALRAAELGAGILLEKAGAKNLRETADRVLRDPSYRKNARTLSLGLRRAGGAKKAAEVILGVARRSEDGKPTRDRNR